MPDQVKDRVALQTYSDAIPRSMPEPEKLPPHPPQFQPYPDVRGTPDFAKMVDLLLQRVPQLREHVKRVVQGPDQASIEALLDSKLQPDTYGHSTLLGTTDVPTRSKISINPEYDEHDGLLQTLAHEFMHAGGKQDEAGAQAGEAVMNKALGLHDRNPTTVKQLPYNMLKILLERQK